jgi:DNA-binding transcriptional LysR family regulator
MLHGVSLDQLRTFIAAADEGSFSAAGRRLRRAQSVVSQTLANLEGQLGLKLFDRSGRFPVLTDQGRALLADARAVASHVDLLKAQARSLAGGLEPELSVAVDIMFPDATFAAAVADFQKEYPTTLLRFDVESTAAYPRNAANGAVTYGRFVTAPARNLSPSDSAGRSRRVRLPQSRRPCGCLASPDIRAAVFKNLAAFSS